MAKVYVFLADGFEDIEALAPVDVLRRGGIDVTTVSVMGRSEVVSAHNVTVVADALIDDCDLSDADLLLLPGGMPGALNLYHCEPLCQALAEHVGAGKLTAAICAAPAVVLGNLLLLEGEEATCYPGFEDQLKGARYTGRLVTESGNFITAEGPAAALPFAYTLLSRLSSEEVAHSVAEGMRYIHLIDGDD